MKILIAVIMMMASSVAFAGDRVDATQASFCADLSVRLALFGVFAHTAPSKEAFDVFAYKAIANGNATQEERKMLAKIVEAAWDIKDQNIRDKAMQFYSGCMGPVGTGT